MRSYALVLVAMTLVACGTKQSQSTDVSFTELGDKAVWYSIDLADQDKQPQELLLKPGQEANSLKIVLSDANAVTRGIYPIDQTADAELGQLRGRLKGSQPFQYAFHLLSSEIIELKQGSGSEVDFSLNLADLGEFVGDFVFVSLTVQPIPAANSSYPLELEWIDLAPVQ